MYDCEADDIDELSFKAGDVIVVVEEIDDSWWVSSGFTSFEQSYTSSENCYTNLSSRLYCVTGN